jgi:hypothetical protein
MHLPLSPALFGAALRVLRLGGAATWPGLQHPCRRSAGRHSSRLAQQWHEQRCRDQEGQAVEPERQRWSADRDDRGAKWRPGYPPELSADTGERVGAGQILLSHQLRHCGGVGGLEEGVDHAKDEVEQNQVPELEQTAGCQQRHRAHYQAAQHIRGEHDPNPRVSVDDNAADQQQKHGRCERYDQQRRHRGRRAGVFEHPPGDGDLVEHIADARESLAGPE